MRLQNAPLVHVLAQVVYSPIWELSERVKAFRAAIHPNDFPWVTEGQVHHVSVTDQAPPRVDIKPRWDFFSADKTIGVMLTEEALVLQTTAYKTSEPFRNRLRSVLRALEEVAGVEFVQRIGLRYIDLVRISPGERFGEYVHAGLLGFPWREAPELQARGIGLRTEAISKTAHGIMAVRSSVLPPGQMLPGDLLPAVLRYPTAITEGQAGVPGLILDFDHFVQFDEVTFRFESEGIVDVVNKLHGGLRTAFEAACTPHALERWGPWINEEMKS
ncbi:TIGR04255 family protein [Gemmatimonas sp.]|jgi:uncharacterized protein (TIGR04255 family)|uniref:TIGR04255 family protein n=1 Tax=Gemmatimonas sp. TaxID=1962908 RepID=UPI0037BEC35E